MYIWSKKVYCFTKLCLYTIMTKNPSEINEYAHLVYFYQCCCMYVNTYNNIAFQNIAFLLSLVYCSTDMKVNY